MVGLTKEMKYTWDELEKHLGELMTAACSHETVVIVRAGKPVATLVHRGPGFKQRTPGRLGGTISYKRTTPIRSRELADLGFEE
jgi:antitoxin (DNA-binding transcriptional repressor) of toxin-antitoxin stability system